MKHLWKKLTALFCVVVMLAALTAVSALAADEAVSDDSAAAGSEAEVLAADADNDTADPADAGETAETDVEAPIPEDPDTIETPAEEPTDAEEEPSDIEDDPAEETPDIEGEANYTWNKSDDAWYLYNSKGEKQLGFATVDGNLYFLDSAQNGNAAAGWVQINDNWYFFDTETRIAAKGHTYVRGSYYYFDEDSCVMAESGLYTAKDGTRYYAQSSGKLASGWLYIGSSWYYFGKDYGQALTGLWTISTNKYYFDKNGVMQTGLFRLPVDSSDTETALYYFQSSGAAMSGWYQDSNGDWYYFGSSSKQALTGFWTINKVGRYFDKDGVMVYGSGETICDDGRIYYFSGSVVKTGWLKNADGTYSYYSTSSGRRAENSAWMIGYKRYVFDENGIMVTNRFATVGDITYCLSSSGAGMTGWVLFNNDYYYFAPYGSEMVVGWQTVKGKTYYFYTSDDEGGPRGSMAHDTVIDGCEIDSNGVALTVPENLMYLSAQNYYSDTDYLFLVDTTNCRVGVFFGSQGSWEQLYDWSCTTGKSGHNTPTGIYTTSSKYYSFGSSYYTCYYGTTFLYKDGYEWLFHSLLYYPGTSTIKGVQLGQHASNGCVRLAIGNAKWIYDYIPTGTKVVSY